MNGSTAAEADAARSAGIVISVDELDTWRDEMTPEERAEFEAWSAERREFAREVEAWRRHLWSALLALGACVAATRFVSSRAHRPSRSAASTAAGAASCILRS